MEELDTAHQRNAELEALLASLENKIKDLEAKAELESAQAAAAAEALAKAEAARLKAEEDAAREKAEANAAAAEAVAAAEAAAAAEALAKKEAEEAAVAQAAADVDVAAANAAAVEAEATRLRQLTSPDETVKVLEGESHASSQPSSERAPPDEKTEVQITAQLADCRAKKAAELTSQTGKDLCDYLQMHAMHAKEAVQAENVVFEATMTLRR